MEGKQHEASQEINVTAKAPEAAAKVNAILEKVLNTHKAHPDGSFSLSGHARVHTVEKA